MQKNYKIDLIEQPISNFLEVLNDIYLPLITKKALNLYVFYLSNNKKEFLDLDIYNENEITSDEFYLLNKTLISLKLIKLFEGEEDSLIKVFSPLSGFNFFQSIALRTVFLSKVDEKYSKEMFNKYLFKINKKYKEITYSLNDCFSFDSLNNKELINSIDKSKALTINGKFSIAKCFIVIKKEFPNLKIEDLSSEEILKITELSNLYGISESKIGNMLIKSIDINKEYGKKVDFTKFNKQVEMYIKYDQKLQSDKNKNDNIKLDLLNDSSNSKLIEYYLTIAPLKLIEDRTKGIKASKKELDILNVLNNKYSLSNGLINVIFDYLLNQYGFINNQYAEDIARVFKRKDINGVFEALDYLSSKKKNSINKEDKKVENKVVINKKEEVIKKEDKKISYLFDETDDIKTDFD